MSKPLSTDDAATVSTAKSSVSRLRPTHDDRYERALLSAYGLEAYISMEKLTSYLVNNKVDLNIDMKENGLLQNVTAALSSSISSKKKQQREEQERYRSNAKGRNGKYHLVGMLSTPQELEMQIAQLNFEIAELRTREEEQILLYDNLRKYGKRLIDEKDTVTQTISRLQRSVEELNIARNESVPTIEELVVRQTECQSRVLQLQHEYDQIMLATSKTFQDYKDRQSYEKELSEQMRDFRSSAKKLAVEKSSIQLALEERTQEYDELQMKVDDIIRQQKEASRSKSLLEQQKEQLFLFVEDQRKENEYFAKKIEEIRNGTCKGRAASLEVILSESPTRWFQRSCHHGDPERGDGDIVHLAGANTNSEDDKEPINLTIRIGDIKKNRSKDESSNHSSASSMSSVTVATKRSLISTIFNPHVHFPFVNSLHHQHHHHIKSKKIHQEKELKKKISEEELQSDDESDVDPLTFWKSRGNDNDNNNG
jgi:hypothetical protein